MKTFGEFGKIRNGVVAKSSRTVLTGCRENRK
jgi:hypothetical protein